MSRTVTLTIADISKAFGTNYEGIEDGDAIKFAMNAMDDTIRSLGVLHNALWYGDEDSTEAHFAHNVQNRLEVAVAILRKMTGREQAEKEPAA